MVYRDEIKRYQTSTNTQFKHILENLTNEYLEKSETRYLNTPVSEIYINYQKDCVNKITEQLKEDGLNLQSISVESLKKYTDISETKRVELEEKLLCNHQQVLVEQKKSYESIAFNLKADFENKVKQLRNDIDIEVKNDEDLEFDVTVNSLNVNYLIILLLMIAIIALVYIYHY